MLNITETNKNPNRTVLITGASGGIGNAIALRFAGNKWNILCHYFSSDSKIRELKKKIDKFHVNCTLLKADFSSPRQLFKFINKLKRYNIDSIINNAATPVVYKYFPKLTIGDLTRTFTINAFAPILITSDIFPRMKEKSFGRIVNISSIAAKYGGSSHSLHYGSSKLALEGLTKTLAREGAPVNVLVNTIRPGVIDTEFYKKFPKDMKKRIEMIPVKKMGRPEDVAEMAYYLGSEKNNFITNQTVAVSGGE